MEGIVKDEQLSENMLIELSRLAIRISARTEYRASVSIYAKYEAFEVNVYINPEKTSRIVAYRCFIKNENLISEYEKCKERLEYFLYEGREGCLK